MKYEDVAIESNLGREYLCEMGIGDWSLGEKVLRVRAFQDGFDQGELNILRQFVEGKLDRDYILEMFGDKLGLGDKE